MKIKTIDRKNYLISIDKTKNRVYLQLHRRRWRNKDTDFLLLDWIEIIAEMQVNFTILSDVRNMQIQSPKLDKAHEEVQKFVAENGLLKLARVLPDNDIVNLQFGRILERSAMPNDAFSTLEDAEEYLDKITKELEESQENSPRME
jgi:hypothetical protein